MIFSNKQTLMCAVLKIACVMAFAYGPGAMAANCRYWNNTTTAVTLNFGTRLTADSLAIPQDAPIGTVIYEDSLQQDGILFKCESRHLYGFFMTPALGVPSGNTYPLGKTGLSFRIKLSDSRKEVTPPISRPSSNDNGWSTGDSTYTLQIFKSDELSLQSRVDAGELGQLKAAELLLITFNLVNPINLNTASCQTPAVTVQMGEDYQLNEFEKSGYTSRMIKFNIALKECQRGIQKVTYQLKANTPVIDQKKGIVSLSSGSSAKGIGLQLMNEAGEPIALDTPYPFSGFNPTGTDFKIPLAASYIRLADSELEAGTADTDVTFIMNYL
ncbi:fimbrial protein [Pseudomonas moraviensis]|uniref:Type 1 fimbria pilin n=1 Tax=Pseudomonas moraviensis TaxID=321662 RepID=A0A7Y9W0W8_9PSED|nr:fimbrial protein [Pseudomonas moraviensis]NYH11653.1 type 1 fimbria pilin [Pseudomonas moraviensis]